MDKRGINQTTKMRTSKMAKSSILLLYIFMKTETMEIITTIVWLTWITAALVPVLPALLPTTGYQIHHQRMSVSSTALPQLLHQQLPGLHLLPSHRLNQQAPLRLRLLSLSVSEEFISKTSKMFNISLSSLNELDDIPFFFIDSFEYLKDKSRTFQTFWRRIIPLLKLYF